jgi:hypothetical protein
MEMTTAIGCLDVRQRYSIRGGSDGTKTCNAPALRLDEIGLFLRFNFLAQVRCATLDVSRSEREPEAQSEPLIRNISDTARWLAVYRPAKPSGATRLSAIHSPGRESHSIQAVSAR